MYLPVPGRPIRKFRCSKLVRQRKLNWWELVKSRKHVVPQDSEGRARSRRRAAELGAGKAATVSCTLNSESRNCNHYVSDISLSFIMAGGHNLIR